MEELVRSPLDPDPEEHAAFADWLAPVAIAIIVGFVVGFLAAGWSADVDQPTTLAADTTIATPVTPPPADPIVPDGYTAIGDIAMGALVAYSQGGNLYVVVNQATRSDNEPQDTNSEYFAEWILRGDGVEIAASRAISSTLSPGMGLIEFPGVTGLPIAGPELVVRGATDMVVREGCNGCGATSVDIASGELVLDGLERPYSLADAVLIPVGEGITLSIDRLEIANDWGYAEWHIIDANDATVRVDLIVRFEGTDDPGRDGINPTVLLPPRYFGVSQQQPTPPNAEPFAEQGTIGLDRSGELLSATNQPQSLVLEWDVEWQHPIGESIPIPLTGITDLGIID